MGEKDNSVVALNSESSGAESDTGREIELDTIFAATLPIDTDAKTVSDAEDFDIEAPIDLKRAPIVTDEDNELNEINDGQNGLQNQEGEFMAADSNNPSNAESDPQQQDAEVVDSNNQKLQPEQLEVVVSTRASDDGVAMPHHPDMPEKNQQLLELILAELPLEKEATFTVNSTDAGAAAPITCSDTCWDTHLKSEGSYFTDISDADDREYEDEDEDELKDELKHDSQCLPSLGAEVDKVSASHKLKSWMTSLGPPWTPVLFGTEQLDHLNISHSQRFTKGMLWA